MHSPYAKHLLEKFGRKATGTTHKLCPNLNDKTNYVTHYRNLQFYVQMGLVVTKIHKIMAFTQRRWLAPYIELNTQKRMNATSTFEKDFYKLMNNSLFGKTMESLRKRIDVRLTDNQIQAERLVAHPAFENFNRINDDVTMLKLRQTRVKWNRPRYVGFCVLELSKLLMYRFHYEKILTRYGDQCQVALYRHGLVVLRADYQGCVCGHERKY